MPAPEWVDPDNRVGIEVAPEDEEITGGGRIEWDGGRIKIAVVGRPNAGKSSLINKLIGSDRLLASDNAGTTRDSVDIEVEEGGRIFQFVDTAGIRRKRSVADQLEKFAVYSAIRSMESADVTILVLDASLRVSEQDAKIASLALERGKGLVVVANKWDLMSSDEERDEFHTSLEKRLSFLKNAPKLQLSALTGRSVHRLFPMLVSVQQERHRRIGTAELNRFFKAVIEAKEPAMKNGRRPKILYGSQPMICPPTFVFMTKRPEDIEESYRRYVRTVYEIGMDLPERPFGSNGAKASKTYTKHRRVFRWPKQRSGPALSLTKTDGDKGLTPGVRPCLHLISIQESGESRR